MEETIGPGEREADNRFDAVSSSNLTFIGSHELGTSVDHREIRFNTSATCARYACGVPSDGVLPACG